MNMFMRSMASLVCLLLACRAVSAGEIESISAADLEARLAQPTTAIAVLDVRTADEFAAGHVPGARNIPFSEIDTRIAELAALKEAGLVVYCRSGRRAELALSMLEAQGFQRLRHLAGDMIGWSESGRRVEVAASTSP